MQYSNFRFVKLQTSHGGAMWYACAILPHRAPGTCQGTLRQCLRSAPFGRSPRVADLDRHDDNIGKGFLYQKDVVGTDCVH